jgi:hypothetical protein
MAAWQAESRARTFKLYHYQNNHSFHISTLARARGQGFSSNTLLAHYLASVAEIGAPPITLSFMIHAGLLGKLKDDQFTALATVVPSSR